MKFKNDSNVIEFCVRKEKKVLHILHWTPEWNIYIFTKHPVVT